MPTPSIPTGRRVVEQGNTYTFDVEPAVVDAKIVAIREGSNATIGQSASVYQWRGTVHLAKRYRYVGLFGDIKDLVDHIAGSYVLNNPTYVQGMHWDDSINACYYKYVQIQNMLTPTCCASVTPVHVEGPMWEIEVDVDATVTSYFDQMPTHSNLKALVSSVADFPEGGSS